MASPEDAARRLNLITRRIPVEDVHDVQLIKDAFIEGRTPRCLWAHIGYFIPILKFADFLDAGVEIVVVLLDVYSFLDNVKYPMEQVLQRMEYYKFIIVAALEAIGIPSGRVRFVQESSYVLKPEFTVDQWKLCTLVPQQAVKDAWDRSYNPDMLSPMLCPGLQTLAEQHLGVDFQFGGADQRGIFEFAERFLPQLGYKKRAHLMNPMLPNLVGGKMSSSHPPDTKIMFLDDPEAVISKICAANKTWKNGSINGVLSSLRDILIPISELRLRRLREKGTDHTQAIGVANCRRAFYREDAPVGTVFTIEVEGEYLHYKSYEEVEHDLTENKLPPQALSIAVATAFNQLLEPIRNRYLETEAWQAVDKLAYPQDA